jgi:hypothetical protein
MNINMSVLMKYGGKDANVRGGTVGKASMMGALNDTAAVEDSKQEMPDQLQKINSIDLIRG